MVFRSFDFAFPVNNGLFVGNLTIAREWRGGGITQTASFTDVCPTFSPLLREYRD